MAVRNSTNTQYPITSGTDRGICFYDAAASTPQIKTSTTLLLNSDGTLNDSTKALFKAYYNANTGTVVPGNTDYILKPNTIAYDLTSSFNTSTGTFTAPTDGKYQFVLSILLASLGILTTRLQLFASTSTESYGIEDRNIGSLLFSGSYRSTGCTDGITMAVGQTLQFKINISGIASSAAIGGGALTTRPSCISGWRIG
jgi:hypothetical protein